MELVCQIVYEREINNDKGMEYAGEGGWRRGRS